MSIVYTKEELKEFVAQFRPRPEVLVEIIAGPSGVGKNWVVEQVIDTHQLLLSTTSRPPRPGEDDDIDMNFISQAEFESALQNGEFATALTINEHYYGFRIQDLENIFQRNKKPLAIIYPFVLDDFLEKFPNSKIRLMFPPEQGDSYLKLLEERLRKRGDTPEEISFRVENTKKQVTELYSEQGSLHKYLRDPRAKLYTIENNDSAWELVKDLRAA